MSVAELSANPSNTMGPIVFGSTSSGNSGPVNLGTAGSLFSTATVSSLASNPMTFIIIGVVLVAGVWILAHSKRKVAGL